MGGAIVMRTLSIFDCSPTMILKILKTVVQIHTNYVLEYCNGKKFENTKIKMKEDDIF